MKNIINWKLFLILLAACVIAAMLVIPYTLALTSSEIELTPILLLLTAAQNLVLFAIVTFIGLLTAKPIGLGAPILQGLLEGKKIGKEFKSLLLPSISLGLIAGVLIVAASIPFNSLLPDLGEADVNIAPWKALLASFYGGIGEEVLLRLFLLSLILWIITKINKAKDGCTTAFEKWFSIIFAAVIFGLGHLPATAQIIPLNGIVIFRAIVLNGIGGVIFGWLYCKKGLESAMIAHFMADIVLHIITPFVVVLIS